SFVHSQTHAMGSVSSLNPPTLSIPLMATNAAYLHICPAKLNAHWLASKTLFDYAMSEFIKWSTKLEIFLQQSSLDCYIFAPEMKPDHLITQLNLNTEPVAYANWLSNNNLIIGMIHAAMLDAEQEELQTDGTMKECYDTLKT
ncbi:hypothetical protein C0995_014985, partial [Termitomyces sp. Mi166